MVVRPKVQGGVLYDNTGSVRPVQGEIKRNNGKLIQAAFSAIPAFEMGMIVVGDDLPGEGAGYMTKVLPLQRDWQKVSQFVNSVPSAYGGDYDECYERALNQARSFKWDADASKFILFIGDACPHSVRHHKNPDRLNWEEEVRALVAQGITVHAVQCLAHYGETFWAKLARLGGGLHFKLDQWSHIESLVLGIAHHAHGGVDALQRYEEQLQSQRPTPVSVRRNFDTLAGRRSTVKSRADGRVPVAASQFQVLSCTHDERQDVKDFCVEKGLIAEKSQFNGIIKTHLFYAHTERREDLRPTHRVVIQDLRTDEMFTGDEARNWLGCPYGEMKAIQPNPLGSDYRVWFESKSTNRKLNPAQEVMIEMTDAIKLAMEEIPVTA